MEQNWKANERKDGVLIECANPFVDLTQPFEKYLKQGIPKEKITIRIEIGYKEGQPYIDMDTYLKVKQKLEELTSHIQEQDSQEEKFVKIAMAIHKNIKYAYSKTNRRYIPEGGNFVEGILKGKCVCNGFASIFKVLADHYGIHSFIATSVITKTTGHAWNLVNLGDNWYHWDHTNLKADCLTITKLGNALHSDRQIEDQKSYHQDRKPKTIRCTKDPTKELKKRLNLYAKQNKHNIPNIRHPFFQTLFPRRQKGLRKRETKALLEARNAIPLDKQMEITQAQVIAQEQGVNLWKVSVWDRREVANKVQTSYVGITEGVDINIARQINPEVFWKIYQALLEQTGQNHYIGNIIPKEDIDCSLFLSPVSCKSMEGEDFALKFSEAIKKEQERKEVLQEKPEPERPKQEREH